MYKVIFAFVLVFAAAVYADQPAPLEFSVDGIEPPQQLVEACDAVITQFATRYTDEWYEEMEACAVRDPDYLQSNWASN